MKSFVFTFLFITLTPACAGLQKTDVLEIDQLEAQCNASVAMRVNGFPLAVRIEPMCSNDLDNAACITKVCIDVFGTTICQDVVK